MMSNGRKKDSSGYLEVRLRNVRSRSTVEHRTVARDHPQVPRRVLTSTVKLDLSTEDDAEEDIEGKITWLKLHGEPKSQVKIWMKETCKTRASFIRENKGLSVSHLVEKFPRLIDTEGMVDQDYRMLFPEAADALFLKWSKYVDHIIKYASKQLDYRQHLQFKGEAVTDEERTNLSILVLPLIFPPGQVRGNKSTKYARATVQEASASFIQRKEIGTNIPQFLDENKVPQPFILALGASAISPEQVFVVVERYTIACGSLLQAIDTCFKTIYVFDVEFPWQSQHVWDFLQKFIYGLGDGKGRGSSVPAVTILRDYLSNAV